MTPLASEGSAASKFRNETNGFDRSDGHTVRKLACVAFTMVRFSETAFALVGTPHKPRIWKLRVLLEPKIGPPFVEVGFRVSTRRQGVRV